MSINSSQLDDANKLGGRVAKAVADLRRTSGRLTTPIQRGEAMVAMANAADLLVLLEADLRRIQEIAGATIDA